MALLFELISFAAKSAIVFVTIAASAAVIIVLLRRARQSPPHGTLEVRHLNERYDDLRDALALGMSTSRTGFKALRKQLKERAKAKESRTDSKPSVYVIDFLGDILATATTSLREEVTAIVSVAKPTDEVVVRLESGGGAVPHYGLAAAQLTRLKQHKLKVTVCIDRVAASGGYMMACVADQLIAAPFSVIGSIGVVVQVPNVHRLLKKHSVDVEEMTAGEFKRTISVFGEITEKGRAKLKEQLEETHALFKAFIKEHRPGVDLAEVATGDHWLGARAKELELVDVVTTSDEYLLSRAKETNLFKVKYHTQASWRRRLMGDAEEFLERLAIKLLSHLRLASSFLGGQGPR